MVVMKVRRRSSVLCVDRGELLTVLLRDPVSRETRHFLPGGGIEEDESPEDAAVREILEETGFHVNLKGPYDTLTYPFEWAGKQIMSETTFFYGDLVKTELRLTLPRVEFDDDTINMGYLWVPLRAVDRCFSFHSQIHGVISRMLRLI